MTSPISLFPRGALRALLPLLALCAVLAAPRGSAAPGERWDRLATPLFDHITLAQGLPHPVAMALAQDGDGFIWIATQRGLARWDGYRMRSFLHDAADPASLPADFVQALHVDARGQVWVGTATAGVAMYDKLNERFIRFAPSAAGLGNAQVNGMASDSRGGIWVGGPAGLDYIEPDGARVKRFRHDPAAPASLANNAVRALHVDRKGVLWIGTSSGLSRRDPANGRFETVPVTHSGAGLWQDAVLSLGENSSGQIAFGTLKSGIGMVDAGNRSARLLVLDGVSDLHANMVLALAEIAPGLWWASTYGGGIVEVEPELGRSRRIQHQPAVPDSLGNDRTAALLRDRSGLVWVGSPGTELEFAL